MPVGPFPSCHHVERTPGPRYHALFKSLLVFSHCSLITGLSLMKERRRLGRQTFLVSVAMITAPYPRLSTASALFPLPPLVTLLALLSCRVGAGLCPPGACLDPPQNYELGDSDSGSVGEAMTATDSPSTDHTNEDDHRNGPDSDGDGMEGDRDFAPSETDGGTIMMECGADDAWEGERGGIGALSGMSGDSSGIGGGDSRVDVFGQFEVLDQSQSLTVPHTFPCLEGSNGGGVGSDGAVVGGGKGVYGVGVEASQVMRQHGVGGLIPGMEDLAHGDLRGNPHYDPSSLGCNVQNPSIMSEASQARGNLAAATKLTVAPPCTPGTGDWSATGGFQSFPSVSSLNSLYTPLPPGERDFQGFDETAASATTTASINAVPPSPTYPEDLQMSALLCGNTEHGHHGEQQSSSATERVHAMREALSGDRARPSGEACHQGTWFYGGSL